MSSVSRTIRVLHGASKEGPRCILVEYKGYAHKRCYCNPQNIVYQSLVKDEPLETALSCPVCEHYRKRLVAFWANPNVFPAPTGSDGQRA